MSERTPLSPEEAKRLAEEALRDYEEVIGSRGSEGCDYLNLVGGVPNLAHALLNALKENERLKMGYGRELRDVEAELAPALGYPWAEDYGWVVGDHSTVSLAMEARRRFEELEGALREIEQQKPYPPNWAGHNVNLIQRKRQIARAALQEQSPGEEGRVDG